VREPREEDHGEGDDHAIVHGRAGTPPEKIKEKNQKTKTSCI
jgi:hypothetical protein